MGVVHGKKVRFTALQSRDDLYLFPDNGVGKGRSK